MSHWARIRFAFMLTVVIVGIVMISDMFFAFHLENSLFAPYVVVPVFVVAYLIAPLIQKRLPYK